MRAIEITTFGGPEVLTLAEVPEPSSDHGGQLIEVTAAGVNFADTHQVEDSYLSKASLPLIPGSEVVGTLPDGRRVAALIGTGGYAERAVVAGPAVFDLPDAVTDGQALALLVQGLSAYHLLRTSTHLAAGESVVVHAAAGGVGTLAVQLAREWAAGRVIAVASTPDKRALAEELGAHVSVDAAAPDLTAALREANDGHPVDVVLEMVGGSTFDASLAAVAPFGRIATFGMASRTPAAPIAPAALMATGRAVVGFWLAQCFARPPMLTGPMSELLALVADGRLRPIVGETYPLADARRAHEDLRARTTIGKLILDPRDTRS